MVSPPCYVYYCSGHGYGHATRVSAFASHLLSLPEGNRPVVHLVSSAPKHVFADSVERGALYRYADWIDPVIVQPLAYCVDREKSVEVLRAFLNKKDAFLETERQWLVSVGARCVLSDAAFLGCLAAKAAGIPSILITNFTFDSVYSYLSTTLVDEPPNAHLQPEGHQHISVAPDIPMPKHVIAPLVEQIHAGYRCADLLVLLPGQIPIPSFSQYPSLPSPDWVNTESNRFHFQIVEFLRQNPSSYSLHPHIPFPPDTLLSRKLLTRKILSIPLLVRPPLSSISVYTPEGRARLLSSIGVPSHLHDPNETRILIVSFGGQVFRRPGHSRSSSRSTSTAGSPGVTPDHSRASSPQTVPNHAKELSGSLGLGITMNGGLTSLDSTLQTRSSCTSPQIELLPLTPRATSFSAPAALDAGSQVQDVIDHRSINPHPPRTPRLATPSHILIPGAPPMLKSFTNSPKMARFSPGFPGIPTLATIPPTPKANGGASYFQDQPSSGRGRKQGVRQGYDVSMNAVESMSTASLSHASGLRQASTLANGCSHDFLEEDLDGSLLLPGSSWIAIVCGVSKEQWGDGGDDELPVGFYVAPRDVYMPDLTAVGDVLLGKLGYGTVSECVDSCTPFVYVARPLFVEEHGLRLLLEREGVGVELSRQSYEDGDWAPKVEEAWAKGQSAKNRKRKEESLGGGMVGIKRREAEGREVAKEVVEWVEECWKGV